MRLGKAPAIASDGGISVRDESRVVPYISNEEIESNLCMDGSGQLTKVENGDGKIYLFIS